MALAVNAANRRHRQRVTGATLERRTSCTKNRPRMRDFWEVTVRDFTKEPWIQNFRMIFPSYVTRQDLIVIVNVKSFLCSFSQIAQHPPNASPKTYLRYMSFFLKWTRLHQYLLVFAVQRLQDVSQRCFSVMLFKPYSRQCNYAPKKQ